MERRVAVGGTRGGLPLGRLTLRVNFPAELGLGVAPNNSRRSLRSLCSDTFGGSVHEAREYARRPQALRSSAPHRSPAPSTAHRDARRRPLCSMRTTSGSAKAWGRCGGGAWEAPRSAGLLAARTKCAPRQLTRGRRPRAANEVSEASSTAGQKTEHCRAVGAKRRPPRSRLRRSAPTRLPRRDLQAT